MKSWDEINRQGSDILEEEGIVLQGITEMRVYGSGNEGVSVKDEMS